MARMEGRCARRRGDDTIQPEKRIAQLMIQYQNLIFSLCYRMSSDYFAAQDLTQETFLAAYRNLDAVRDGNYKTWLCRIAANKCIDYQRKNARLEVTEAERLDQYQAGGCSPSAVALEQELREELRENCMKLRPPYNDIALAYFYDERTAEEIALRLGKNVKTIQTQIYRAREMLRKAYRELRKELYQ